MQVLPFGEHMSRESAQSEFVEQWLRQLVALAQPRLPEQLLAAFATGTHDAENALHALVEEKTPEEQAPAPHACPPRVDAAGLPRAESGTFSAAATRIGLGLASGDVLAHARGVALARLASHAAAVFLIAADARPRVLHARDAVAHRAIRVARAAVTETFAYFSAELPNDSAVSEHADAL